jgi:hypothetical protein
MSFSALSSFSAHCSTSCSNRFFSAMDDCAARNHAEH